MHKKQITYENTTQYINNQTGEIESVERTFTRKVTKEKFALIYLTDIKSIIDLASKAEFKVLLSLVNIADFNTNRIILVKPIKQQIAEAVGLSYSSVTGAINRLHKKNIIIRKETPIYYLNPKWFFKGEEVQRAKTIKLILNYTISD